MIKSFKDSEAEKIIRRQFSRRLPQDVQRAAFRRLTYLHAAERLTDLLTPPANRLERLTGGREGQYSIGINDQWRICFVWHENDAYDVEIVDHH